MLFLAYLFCVLWSVLPAFEGRYEPLSHRGVGNLGYDRERERERERENEGARAARRVLSDGSSTKGALFAPSLPYSSSFAIKYARAHIRSGHSFFTPQFLYY